jgi:hypothetical protein
MRQSDKLPGFIRHEFINFLQNHPPQAFSNSLRSLLLDYMQREAGTGLPLHFDRFLWSLSDLFDLLDTATLHLQELREKNGKKKRKHPLG